MANQDKKDKDVLQNDKSSKQSERPAVTDQSVVQERLGFGLRSMYRSMLEEPLPDDMMALLDQLDDTDDSDAAEQKPGRKS